MKQKVQKTIQYKVKHCRVPHEETKKKRKEKKKENCIRAKKCKKQIQDMSKQ